MPDETPMPFTVVGNAWGRLSVWPAGAAIPPGWSTVGYTGSRDRCVTWIEQQTRPQSPRPGVTGDTLVSIFTDTVRRYGDRPSVSDDEATLTYHELDARSSRLAIELTEAGVAMEDTVALCLRRGIDVVVAILGILRAGCAYVAVDAHLPSARRNLMIRRSGARLVLTEPERTAEFAEVGGDVPVRGWTSRESGSESVITTAVGASNAACILFTSGSSGEPKAVVLEHAGLAAFARNPVFADLRSDDRTAHVSTLSFDAFHFELWCTMAAGAELVILPTLSDLLGSDVRRELRRRRISAMLVPTMALHHLVREDRDTFASVRLLYTGGDVLARETCVDLLNGEFAGRFVNLYGPTEATTACMGYEVRAAGPVDESIPIGVALHGCRVTVRDGDLSPTPVGQIGGLYVGGPGVARGYLNDPGRTADCFLPDPDGEPGSLMYATGDLARVRPDGLVEFRGRADDQVKIRGFRVEIGEVERAIARHPKVREAAVLAAGTGDERHLASFVVALELVTPAELRSYAAAGLPDHMVPRVILVVDHIPSNDHGKRDRERLSEWLEAHRRREESYVEPATETERYVARLWGSLLAVDRVGSTDDFFELGGHSLLAFRVQRRIRHDLGVDLDFTVLLDNSQLRDLAIAISTRLGESA